MQKFKFKLDGLLKVREFKEKKVKIELGEILREINAVEDKIAAANAAIAETYDAQETFMQDPSQGQMLQFFPLFIQGKKEDIKNKENLLWSLKKKYDVKIAELATARGELTDWKKVKNKKEQEGIEEILQMRAQGSKDI